MTQNTAPIEISQLADVFTEHYEGQNALRSINLTLLARLISGSTEHGALV